jgi:hypothetical protein
MRHSIERGERGEGGRKRGDEWNGGEKEETERKRDRERNVLSSALFARRRMKRRDRGRERERGDRQRETIERDNRERERGGGAIEKGTHIRSSALFRPIKGETERDAERERD